MVASIQIQNVPARLTGGLAIVAVTMMVTTMAPRALPRPVVTTLSSLHRIKRRHRMLQVWGQVLQCKPNLLNHRPRDTQPSEGRNRQLILGRLILPGELALTTSALMKGASGSRC